ncbi:hypothetical protein [Citrobacter sp. C411]|uniref:hypothetical protein n=1 Tax=Citrobacter sp. C411 TaxID=3048144 RepID=UPI0039C3A5F2
MKFDRKLKDVCRRLTDDHGHHDIWLYWREWSPKTRRSVQAPPWKEQPVVVSRSGRALAWLDGETGYWQYSGMPGYDPDTDGGDDLPEGDLLDTQYIAGLMDLI